MVNDKIVKDLLSQTIGNRNLESNYSLQCIFCGNDRNVIEIAHRNGDKHITGYIVVCKKCFKILDMDKLHLKIEAGSNK